MISVLIPCKNAVPYLDICIQSIIEQTIDEWEVIIVDDHSTDTTWHTIIQYSSKDKRIKPFKNKGHGIINALRVAFEKSDGQYITRMDADDIMATNKLETMYNQLKQHGEGFVATGLVQYFREDKPLGDGYIRYADWLNKMSMHGTNFLQIYKECSIASPCWMMHRSDLDNIHAFNEFTYPEDYDLVFRMYKHKLKVIPSRNYVIHHWRDYSERSSRNDPNYSDNRFLDLKIKYFLEIDYDKNMSLVIWGAGKKGKYIAKSLTALDIPYTWITNNPKKIGHNIYGVILKDSRNSNLLDNAQVLLSAANKRDQQLINSSLDAIQIEKKFRFWFC